MAFSAGLFGDGHFNQGVLSVKKYAIPVEDVTQPILYHDLYAQSRLLEQYTESNISFLVSSLAGSQIQDLEFALQSIKPRMSVISQSGSLLDLIGAVVGFSRSDFDDDTYKRLLLSKIAVNVSTGKLDQLLDVWSVCTGNQPVEAHEHFPGEIALITSYPVDSGYVADLFLLLQAATGGAIPVTYIHISRPGDFGFEDSGQGSGGFGDITDPDIGGSASYLQISL